MPEIKSDKIEFLNSISESVKNISDKKEKLKFLITEHWHQYSSGWLNLIISINKNIFLIPHQRPLEGLKEAYLDYSEEGDEKRELLDSFRRLIKDWDDVFGDSYYDLPDTLFNFVFDDTPKILSALSVFVDESKVLSEVGEKYISGWGIK